MIMNAYATVRKRRFCRRSEALVRSATGSAGEMIVSVAIRSSGSVLQAPLQPLQQQRQDDQRQERL